jgi:hypothetical protein
MFETFLKHKIAPYHLQIYRGIMYVQDQQGGNWD